MKLEFRTTIDNESRETHDVLLDDTLYLSQSECIEPEDVLFCRDLESPHNCKNLILDITERLRNGEKLYINEVTVEE